MRIGHGYDVHRLTEDRKLILGGVEIPYEEVNIQSYDLLRLHGYLYKNPKSDEVVIMFHGYRGGPHRDFSGGAYEMIKMNKNVILVDERAHGKSKGHSITFGRKEQYDVLNWINYARSRFGQDIKITLVGISMGGAIVLFAADKVDKNVKIIADAPYSREKDIILYTMKQMKLPANFLYPFVHLASVIYSHARLVDDAVNNVANSQSKILIIHGTGDSIVPYQSSERVYLANKNRVQYELFEGAEHGISYLVDTERYRKIINDFMK